MADYASEVLADLPTAYYRLGEVTGTTATDASGNGRHGTYVAGYTLAADGLLTMGGDSPIRDTDKAVSLDGAASEISTASLPALSAAWALEAWVKVDAVGSIQIIMSRASSRFLRIDASGRVRLGWLDTTPAARELLVGAGVMDVVPGAIYHIVGAHDGASTATIYINGVARASVATWDSDGGSAGVWSLGRAGGGNFLDGTLDEVAFYAGTALGAARVAEHYRSRLDGPTYAVEAEFVVGSFTNVSSECLEFTLQRQLARAFVDPTPGTAMLVMDNEGRRWSPDNAAGPWYPNLKPQRKIRVSATYAGTTYRLFTGFLDSIAVDPEMGSRRTTLKATDRLRKVAKVAVTLNSVFTDANVGSVWTATLSHALVSSRAIDALYDTLPYAWFDDEEADQAIGKLLAHGHGFAYLDGGDKFVVKERYWPVRQSVAGSYVNSFLGFGYTLTDADVVNRATVLGTPRKKATDVQSVAWIDRPILIPASGGVGFELTYRDQLNNETRAPCVEMVTPVNSTDYTTNTASNGGGTDRTSVASASVTFRGASAVCSLFNGSGDAVYLTKFVLRGKPVQKQPDIAGVTEDSSSQNVYGLHALSVENDFIHTAAYAKDYSLFLVAEKKEPLGDITLGLKNVFPDVIARELGDLIAVVESHTAVGSQWLVAGLEHTVRLGRGLEHELALEVDHFRDPEWLILDHATKGKLDERRLAF